MEKRPSLEKTEKFDFEKSPIKEAYLLLGARTPLELSNLYSAEDQKLMKTRLWDYMNPDLVVNKIKEILDSVDSRLLTEDEKEWTQEIVWFWYHHAISCAVSRYKDKVAAQEYATKALEIQPEDHPNEITKLLYLLVNDRLEEAEKHASSIVDVVEKETGASLLEWYKEGLFY